MKKIQIILAVFLVSLYSYGAYDSYQYYCDPTEVAISNSTESNNSDQKQPNEYDILLEQESRSIVSDYDKTVSEMALLVDAKRAREAFEKGRDAINKLVAHHFDIKPEDVDKYPPEMRYKMALELTFDERLKLPLDTERALMQFQRRPELFAASSKSESGANQSLPKKTGTEMNAHSYRDSKTSCFTDHLTIKDAVVLMVGLFLVWLMKFFSSQNIGRLNKKLNSLSKIRRRYLVANLLCIPITFLALFHWDSSVGILIVLLQTLLSVMTFTNLHEWLNHDN